VRELVPGIPVAKILIQRDETTKEKTPVLYYKKWPKNVANKTALICDPMLATGGSVIMGKQIIELSKQLAFLFSNQKSARNRHSRRKDDLRECY
jgi:uracil phosphoribosyltransferase